MNTTFYHTSNYLNIIPLKTFIGLSGQKTIFPFYHLISDEPVNHVKHLYKVRTTREFVRDLDFLLKEFEPVDPGEFLSGHNQGSGRKKPGFVLSFDDGLSQFYHIIAPILLQKGIPAIVFLNSGFIDNKDLFFRYKASILKESLLQVPANDKVLSTIKAWTVERGIPFDSRYDFLFSFNYKNRHDLDQLAGILGIDFQDYLKTQKPYLETGQIKQLLKQGFRVGSHSTDHPKYMDISLEEQLWQTVESTDYITATFALDYKLFAFPFTDYGVSKIFFDTVFSAQRILDLSFGCAGMKNDECPRNIQRIPLEIGSFSAEEIIRGEYLYYLFKKTVNRNKIRR
jgi:peptidoglycan/xylan/chitin deacetylase (PgdA/CDA1 family)